MTCAGGCGKEIDGMCSECLEGAHVLNRNAIERLRVALAQKERDFDALLKKCDQFAAEALEKGRKLADAERWLVESRDRESIRTTEMCQMDKERGAYLAALRAVAARGGKTLIKDEVAKALQSLGIKVIVL